ncbi:G-protein coupled receptor Mth isoform X2 [Fopius arisanus]|uniref:G-protein coupled receptor Mth isoform X2 n=1 Tax=Fopius arisanus TaxID=64838 RepID=A0A9R1SXQ0_9HYME|nr:PREDICTED: G-protein coupled receptor Mth isoform X2 [Fopius arisanus]
MTYVEFMMFKMLAGVLSFILIWNFGDCLDWPVKTIGKCCAKGEIISAGKNFSCVPQNISSELLKNETMGDNWVHFDECPDAGEVTIVKFSDVVDKGIDRINASSGCLDLFDGEDKLGVIPVIVHCKEHHFASLRIPKLNRFRVCCPRGLIYDSIIHDCIWDKSIDRFDIADYIFDIIGNHSLVEFSSFSRGPPQCKHAIVDYVIDSRTDLQILGNGTIRVSISSGTSVLLTEENSCLDRGTSSWLILRLCTGVEYCRRNACVRKCCPEGQARIGRVCQTIPQGTVPPGEFHRQLEQFSRATSNHSKWKPLDTAKYGLLIGEHSCEYGKYSLMPDEQPVIDSRGHIHIHHPEHERFRHHEYCMEIFRNVTSYDDGFHTAVCFSNPEPPEPNKWRFGINAALELTSCMFLLITFLVYVFLPLLQNLHGKTLMCHVASLFAAYACLAAIALTKPPDRVADTSPEDDEDNEISSDGGCKFLGYAMLFSFLAAFSWLNVMCFDIWWTFGGLGGAGGRRGAQRKRFFLYSLYAWGLAFILTCVAVTADYTSTLPTNLRPNIGIDTCWFNPDSSGVVIFFITPISIQLVANVAFFILTSLHCSRVRAEITRVMRPVTDPRSRRFHSDRSKLIVNIKLFIVMGISWIMEIISTFLNRYATDFNWRAEFFYVSDAFNCLQGLLIFILFVLKSKVYHALRHRLKEGSGSTPGRLNTTLQEPFRVQKSTSCSTLMSTFAINNVP